jgi:hypothetical protein
MVRAGDLGLGLWDWGFGTGALGLGLWDWSLELGMCTVIDEYIHFWHITTFSSFFCSCISACLIIVLHSHRAFTGHV